MEGSIAAETTVLLGARLAIRHGGRHTPLNKIIRNYGISKIIKMTQGLLLVLVLSVLLLAGRVQPADDVRNLVLTLEIRVAFKNAVLISSKCT